MPLIEWVGRLIESGACVGCVQNIQSEQLVYREVVLLCVGIVSGGLCSRRSFSTIDSISKSVWPDGGVSTFISVAGYLLGDSSRRRGNARVSPINKRS